MGAMTSDNLRNIPEAEPENAVQPDPIGYDLDAADLLLHTVQAACAVDQLRNTGTLTPDPRLGDEYNHEPCKWLSKQMTARLSTTGPGILWLWAQRTREKLVEFCGSARGEVLLTCRVPRERVLLSNYEGWNAVTGRTLAPTPPAPGESQSDALARNKAMSDSFDARLRDAEVQFGAPFEDWPSHLRAEAEQSWEGIFDHRQYGPLEEWQATVHMLHLKDVTSMVRIA
jgi:Domain of unknown function (DUF3841)